MTKKTRRLISLLVSIFTAAACLRMHDGKTYSDGSGRAIKPGLFYREGVPVRAGYILAFMRAIKPNGRVPMIFVHNAQTDARTDATTDLSAFLLQ